MGKQILKQPDGKYAVWSTIINHFVLFNSDLQELIDFLENEPDRVDEKGVRAQVAVLDRWGKSTYGAFETFDEAMAWVRAHYGDDDETLNQMLAHLPGYVLPPPAFDPDEDE